ncbi:siphovirus Gp157 family protein [Streptococcus vestibularis]|nr:siphovirus Gp157 family protein [Streptococcus vestibularis]
MAKLYELTGIFLEIDEMDVDDETKLDTLDSIDWEHDFSEKIENCIKVIRNKNARVEAYKAEIARLDALKKSENKAIEEIKKRISEAMHLTQHDKLETTLFKVGFRKSKAVVVDEDKLPKKYQIVSYKPDKKEIKKLLESGSTIRGAHIEERSNLSIR